MGFFKSLGKILDVVKPFISMVNPMLGAAIGLASGLMQGKNPLQSILGAVTDMFPGGGAFKNILGAFGNGGILDGAGGNSLIGSAMNLFGGSKGGITNIIGDVFKSVSGSGNSLTDLGRNNLTELAAQKFSQLLA